MGEAWWTNTSYILTFSSNWHWKKFPIKKSGWPVNEKHQLLIPVISHEPTIKWVTMTNNWILQAWFTKGTHEISDKLCQQLTHIRTLEKCWGYGGYGLQRKSEWGWYTQCLNLCNLEPNKQSVWSVWFLADFASCVLSKLDLGKENPPFCWLVLFRSPFLDGSVLNCLSDDLDVRDMVGIKGTA